MPIPISVPRGAQGLPFLCLLINSCYLWGSFNNPSDSVLLFESVNIYSFYKIMGFIVISPYTHKSYFNMFIPPYYPGFPFLPLANPPPLPKQTVSLLLGCIAFSDFVMEEKFEMAIFLSLVYFS